MKNPYKIVTTYKYKIQFQSHYLNAILDINAWEIRKFKHFAFK